MIIILFLILNIIILILTSIHYNNDNDNEGLENQSRNIYTIVTLSVSLLLTIVCTLLYFLKWYSIIEFTLSRESVQICAIVSTLISSYASWDFFTRSCQINERNAVSSMMIFCIIIATVIQIGQTIS